MPRKLISIGLDINAAPAVPTRCAGVLYVPPEREERAVEIVGTGITIRVDPTLGPNDWYIETPR